MEDTSNSNVQRIKALQHNTINTNASTVEEIKLEYERKLQEAYEAGLAEANKNLESDKIIRILHYIKKDPFRPYFQAQMQEK